MSADKGNGPAANGAGVSQAEIGVDPQARTVTIKQRQHLHIHTSVVVVPFDAVKMLAAQVLMIEVQQGAEVRSSTAVPGEQKALASPA